MSKNTIHLGAAFIGCCFAGIGPSGAHSGALDGNGCHYQRANGACLSHKEVAPNPDVNAPLKKSRANICHDSSSPNYLKVRYFISFPGMPGCLECGGRVLQ